MPTVTHDYHMTLAEVAREIGVSPARVGKSNGSH